MSIISAGGAVTGAGGPAGPNPRDYFNTVLYTGNGSTQSITGVGFQPDFVWVKARSIAYANRLYDAVRGFTKELYSNLTDAENTEINTITAVSSDGFSLGNALGVNGNTQTFVAWCWKANGAGSSNTDGSITSTVSANTDAGFSIVKYVETGGSYTVGHGLGVAPDFIIWKFSYSIAGEPWVVWNKYWSPPTTNGLRFITNGQFATGSNWLGSVGTSTFGITAGQISPGSGNVIAYCFAEKTGFSKTGSYTGNGSATGPSVTTDFQPTWLMIKRSDSTGDWIIHDSARDASNPRTAFLEPNTADAEATGNDVDFNSTGFQIKSSSATVNANGGNYIYMCFA